jgi:hypothetical protein
MRRLLIISTLATGSCSSPFVVNEMEMDRVDEVSHSVSRPRACEHLRREYTEDEWDPVTETYPENVAWNDCMGVGRR